ncbi:class I SAM-dependent methyltransferase [Fodinibius sp. Rm-B-1B1-1]|uniref:class I SAM-dependent methyltransferase n=1 Tax=Fodinibius alkaliphilus TaxID=3140241 RepID=UPI00315A3445
MTLNILKSLQNYFRSEPPPEIIAQQLRHPSGDLAEEIGNKMNEANEPLYDLVLDVMQIENYDKILEIGFGNGKFFNRLFKRAEGLQVMGIDYSQEMVRAAKRINNRFIASEKLNLQRGNSDQLPYSDHCFDKVFCNMVIYFWDEPETHLSEIHRVLKSDGKFYAGLRSHKSMLNFPFVKYGFTLFKVDEWKRILVENEFSFLDIQTKLDPEMKFNGNEFQLESCCIVAAKGL